MDALFIYDALINFKTKFIKTIIKEILKTSNNSVWFVSNCFNS